MTNSSLDLSARADLAWLADLIGDAQRAVPSVEWLIVGALARDLHLSYAHGMPPMMSNAPREPRARRLAFASRKQRRARPQHALIARD